MTALSQPNTFEPSSDLIQEEDCDTLLFYLPGFKKEQLRVQLSKSGFLKISGTSPMGENKWSSFQKDFKVPQNCDTTKITAKFEGGVLYVMQPKLIAPPKQENKEAPQPQNNTVEAKDTINDQGHVDARKTGNDENAPKELPEKPVQEEPKSQNEERKSSSKNDEGKNVEENIKSEFAEKRNKENDDVGKVDGNKLDMESLAGKVKKGRKMLSVVLVVLVAFGLGMYFNNLIWCSTSSEPKN